ncbi:hypothetical protein [Streptomyces buecherae]|uniref:hypothetical protein n=1 Tax=Streptomyces buecherae TaxID=2763006 RepID=UPI0037B927A8
MTLEIPVTAHSAYGLDVEMSLLLPGAAPAPWDAAVREAARLLADFPWERGGPGPACLSTLALTLFHRQHPHPTGEAPGQQTALGGPAGAPPDVVGHRLQAGAHPLAAGDVDGLLARLLLLRTQMDDLQAQLALQQRHHPAADVRRGLGGGALGAPVAQLADDAGEESGRVLGAAGVVEAGRHQRLVAGGGQRVGAGPHDNVQALPGPGRRLPAPAALAGLQ